MGLSVKKQKAQKHKIKAAEYSHVQGTTHSGIEWNVYNGIHLQY